MKRNFTIRANGGNVIATVRVEVKCDSGSLMRYEMERLVQDLADEIMKPIPGIRYLRTPLSRMKITGF